MHDGDSASHPAADLEHGVDLSVEPDTMVAIRDDLRDRLVRRVHRLRMHARALRKVGQLDRSRRQEREIERTIRMIRSLENPNDPSALEMEPELDS